MQPQARTQVLLDFADGEAHHADRLNAVRLAVEQISGGKDLRLRIFAEWCLEAWERGGPLVRSYRELAGPYQLACSPEKARSIVAMAQRSGLVRVEPRASGMGQQQANAYRLVPEAIRAILRHEGLGVPDQGLGVPDQGLGVPDQGLGVPDQGLGVPDQGSPPTLNPGGETPRAGAGALLDLRSIPNIAPSSIDRSVVRFDGGDEVLTEKAREVYERCWPRDSQGCRRRLTPPDRRLVFQTATLLLFEDWAEAADEAVLHVEISQPPAKNPAAMLTKALGYYTPGVLKRVRVAARFFRPRQREPAEDAEPP